MSGKKGHTKRPSGAGNRPFGDEAVESDPTTKFHGFDDTLDGDDIGGLAHVDVVTASGGETL